MSEAAVAAAPKPGAAREALDADRVVAKVARRLVPFLVTAFIVAYLDRVNIGFPPGADEPLVYDDPQTGLEGKFSVQYPVAALLLDGKLTTDTFTDQAVQRPAVREMMKKVHRYRVADDKIYSGTVGYTDVELVTKHGTFSRRVDKGPGSSTWPMTEREHEEKFLDCAGRVLDAASARALLDLLRRCEELADVRLLTRAMAIATPRETYQTVGAPPRASR